MKKSAIFLNNLLMLESIYVWSGSFFIQRYYYFGETLCKVLR